MFLVDFGLRGTYLGQAASKPWKKISFVWRYCNRQAGTKILGKDCWSCLILSSYIARGSFVVTHSVDRSYDLSHRLPTAQTTPSPSFYLLSQAKKC